MIESLGIEFIKYLQSMHNEISPIMELLAILVKVEFSFVFVVPLLFWNSRPNLIAPLYALLMVDVMLGDILKVILAQPRPFWIADIIAIDKVTSVYSSPSGYSSLSTVFWGYFYLHLRHKAILPIGCIFILSTGLSKMYHASMMPDHMVLGIIQGCLVLWLYWKYESKIALFIKQSTIQQWLLMVFSVIGLAYGAMYIAFLIHDTYQIPLQYIEYKMIASQRFAGGGITMSAGFFIGSTIGFKRLITTKSDIQTLSRMSRIALSVTGLAVVIVLMVIIRTILIDSVDSRIQQWLINIIVTSLSSYWIFYSAPIRFIRASST